jgi:hypothetical protein
MAKVAPVVWELVETVVTEFRATSAVDEDLASLLSAP